MSIKNSCAEVVRWVRASDNLAQIERVSGIGYSTLRAIRRAGEIGNVSTAITLEQAQEILGRDSSRGLLRRGRKAAR